MLCYGDIQSSSRRCCHSPANTKCHSKYWHQVFLTTTTINSHTSPFSIITIFDLIPRPNFEFFCGNLHNNWERERQIAPTSTISDCRAPTVWDHCLHKIFSLLGFFDQLVALASAELEGFFFDPLKIATLQIELSEFDLNCDNFQLIKFVQQIESP